MTPTATAPTRTATPPTSVSAIEEGPRSNTPRVEPPLAAADSSLLPLGADLQALIDLDEDWDSYGALPPSPTALTFAWRAASSLLELGARPQVFPTRRGGVQLEWHGPRTSLEWEIDPDAGTGVFIFDNHATGERFDGDLPADLFLLASALAQVYADR